MLSPAVFESLKTLLVTLHSVSTLASVTTDMIHQVEEYIYGYKAPNHNPNKTLSLSSCSFYVLPQITVFKLIFISLLTPKK